MHSNKTVALKPNFMSSLLLRAVFLLICIFLNNSFKLKSSYNEDPEIFDFHIIGLKFRLYPDMPC